MQCEVRNPDGSQCGCHALTGETKCLLHSGRAEELGRRGGRAGLKTIRRPRTAKQVARLISQCTVELHAGTLDAATGKALVSAAGVLLRAIRLSDHELRIRKLEQIKQQEERGGRRK